MTGNNGINQIFESFEGIKVLIVGDVMLDDYAFGTVSRISPEAPIPVLDIYKKDRRLGGAANVALNLKALGATPLIASVVGDDAEGHILKRHLQNHGIENANVLLDQERTTTIKTRLMSRNQHVMRYDYEQTSPLDEKTELLLIDNIIDILYNEQPSVLVFQDYNKGVLTPKVIANVIHNCQQAKIPVAVDPKFDNFMEYKGCTLFKPNLKEVRDGLGMNVNPSKTETLVEADLQLRNMLRHTYSAITLSERGIFVGSEDDNELIPAYYSEIVDVAGAGDTVISIYALGLALGLDIFATSELANIAAGLVCKQAGVVPINRELLLKEAALFFGAAAS